MKQIKRKGLSTALVRALGASAVLTVATTAADAQQAQRVEKIEVTGTNIKRVDQETVAPVEIITREQIERTGMPTVAEVLRNIPSNSGGSFSESFTNSFAPGASGISLRGLGQKTTQNFLWNNVFKTSENWLFHKWNIKIVCSRLHSAGRNTW